MYKVLFYTTDESLLRIFLEGKKQPRGYFIQELCLYFRNAPPLLLKHNCVTAIPPSSAVSTEIPIKVHQKMPGSPNNLKQSYTKKGFFKFKPNMVYS